MKRLIVFAGSLALVIASSQPSASAAGNSLVSPSVAERPTPVAAGTPLVREVTLPAGTVLPVDLETAVGSDISRVEQPVHARLRRAVFAHGVQVLPAGTGLSGYVTSARRPGKVKGRGYVAMRFTELDTPGRGTERISTATIGRLAPATKQQDALKILAPAVGGAVIGRVVGGKSGAAKGALIGGGAGTGWVLTTRGKEVRIGRGADLSVRLTAPVTVRVNE